MVGIRVGAISFSCRTYGQERRRGGLTAGHGRQEGDGVAVFEWRLVGGELVVDGDLQLSEAVREVVGFTQAGVERCGRGIAELAGFFGLAREVGQLCEIEDFDLHAVERVKL